MTEIDGDYKINSFDYHLGKPSLGYRTAISLGRVDGISLFRKFGENSAVGTSYEDVWVPGGSYVFPTGAETLSVFSDNAADTSAGTGARTVKIIGLDASLLEIEETVTLNGVTPVTTSNEFYRVNKMLVLTAGSAGSNVGEIEADQSTSGLELADIAATEGSTLQLIYTVPMDKSVLVNKMLFSAHKGDEVTYRLLSRPPGGAWAVTLVQDQYQALNEFEVGVMYTCGTDIRVEALKVSGSSGAVTCAVEGLIFDDDYRKTS